MRPERQPERRDEIAQDHVEEDARDRVLPTEGLLERGTGEHEEQRSLTRDRSDRRRAIVDEALVAERLAGSGEADADPPITADQHLLDGTVDRQEAPRRRRSLREECRSR